MHRKNLAFWGAIGTAALVAVSACSTNAATGGSSSATSPATSAASAATSSAASAAAPSAGSSAAPAVSAPSSGSASASSSAAGSGGAAAASSAAGAKVTLPKKDKYVIGYSQSNNAEPYRAQLNTQLQYYVKQHANLQLLPIADAAQDSSRQVSQVQQFIQQKVDILIVSPNEADPLTPPVEQACKAGIPVIILDRSVNTDCIAAFIGGDNVAIGKAAGELAVTLDRKSVV